VRNPHRLISILDKGVKRSGVGRKSICIVSDIRFPISIAKEDGLDYFHTPRGRAIPFSVGMKLANPDLKVIAFPGDLATIGGNHFVHGGRKNIDITVVFVNSFYYNTINGKKAPLVDRSFSPYGGDEKPFNIPFMAKACGAVYVARWTALHAEELSISISEAINKVGFSVIDLIYPQKNFYELSEDSGEYADLLEFYHENSEIAGGVDIKETEILGDKKILVGKFHESERLDFIQAYNAMQQKMLGEKFKPYGVKQ